MSEELIHPTAVVSPDAEIAPDAEIGPFAIIEDNVSIGAGTAIGPHACIRRFTRIGRNNSIDAHSVIGGIPQHLKFDHSETGLEIGDDNIFREGVTIHRAFEPGNATRIGSNCFFMTYAHVGHDCQVADGVTLTNNVVLGGHVEIGESAIMGGCSGAHQFVRVGAFCMVAGFVPLRKDVIPFTMVGGEPVRHYRLNTIGLRRGGMGGERYRALEAAFRALRDGDRDLDAIPETDDVAFLREWLAGESKYGYYGFAGPSA